MTTKVVGDDVRITFNKRRLELENRVAGEKVDVERAADLLQLALENPPTPCENSSRTYVLESSWAYDNAHREFFTYTLEYCDYMSDGISFDDLLHPKVSVEKEKELLAKLARIYSEQVPGHGSREMLRLYRVLGNRVFGRSSSDLIGELERDVVDVHFILKPICDFDDKGEPIPCRVSAAAKKNKLLSVVPKEGDIVYIPSDKGLKISGGKAKVNKVIPSTRKELFDYRLELQFGGLIGVYNWDGERGLAGQQYQLALKFGDSWAHDIVPPAVPKVGDVVD